MTRPDPNETATEFWERIYEGTSAQTSGRPSEALARFVQGRPAGKALDLGCAKGDDAIWLARQGWKVTAVDISKTALGYARQNAKIAGVLNQISFERHDLAASIPGGRYDLVTALFLQTPMEFPRVRVLNQVANSLDPGGLFLIVVHGTLAPWSWNSPDTIFPTALENLEELKLDLSQWTPLHVGDMDRMATGPEGQTAPVTDRILALERNA